MVLNNNDISFQAQILLLSNSLMLIGGGVDFVNCSNDGLLAFVENFVKDHFLPTMFVDYRKGVQQAISSKSLYCSDCSFFLLFEHYAWLLFWSIVHLNYFFWKHPSCSMSIMCWKSIEVSFVWNVWCKWSFSIEGPIDNYLCDKYYPAQNIIKNVWSKFGFRESFCILV